MARTVRIGEKDLRVLPLNLKALKALAKDGHLEKLSSVGEIPNADQMDSVVAFITSALSRATPDITPEWVEENVTIDRLTEVLTVVMEEAGFKAKASGPNAESP